MTPFIVSLKLLFFESIVGKIWSDMLQGLDWGSCIHYSLKI